MRDADIAMYDVKKRGRGGYAIFDEAMHRRAVDRLALENELRHAVEQSLLRVHYQPIVDLATGQSIADPGDGSEAIVRSTVAMAHNLGMHVIAEGVETAAQLQRLRTLGCEFGQGFLFSAPCGADDIRALFETWSPLRFAALTEGQPRVALAS